MKKVFLALVTACLVLCASACSGNASPLQTIKDASPDQLAAIEKVIADNNISVKTCKKGTIEDAGNDMANSLASALAESFVPYDLVDENGAEYRLTLRKEDMTVFAIVDADGNFVYGSVAGLFE